MNPTFTYGEPGPWSGQGEWSMDHAGSTSTPADAPPRGFQAFWDNYLVDVMGALPGLLYAIDPDKYRNPPAAGGSGGTVIVRERSNSWLLWVLAAVVLIVIIVLIVKK